MTTVQKSIIVPYSVKDMFELVDNIEAYPLFLPWCKGAIIHFRQENQVEATIQVAKGPLQYSFTTRNRLDPPNSIHMELVQGPFKHLRGSFKFEETPSKFEGTPNTSEETPNKFEKTPNPHCIIHLDFNFEFENKLLGLTLGPIFTKATGTILEAFENRARELYGKK